MTHVFACIDGLAGTAAVIDAAAWAALRLNAPLNFLHVLERQLDRAAFSDYSGTIGLGAQESLLQELSELDARRSKLAQEAGRQLLASARERAAAQGLSPLDTRLRHGLLADNLLEMEGETRLAVLGEHAPAHHTPRIHLDHHVERVVRALKRPVLVIPGERFEAPACVALAFDGSATGRQMVQTVAASPLLLGLPLLLVMVGGDEAAARIALDWARQTLSGAGFEVSSSWLAGEPEQVLPDWVKAQGAGLLVMGAYGHSRLRQWVVGSTTTTLLRLSEVPVLILR